MSNLVVAAIVVAVFVLLLISRKERLQQVALFVGLSAVGLIILLLCDGKLTFQDISDSALKLFRGGANAVQSLGSDDPEPDPSIDAAEFLAELAPEENVPISADGDLAVFQDPSRSIDERVEAVRRLAASGVEFRYKGNRITAAELEKQLP